MPRIEEVMTRTELSATTNQTPRRSTRRQPDAISNGVSKHTPSAKKLEISTTTSTQSLKSTKDSLKIVKNAKKIVKNLPSSREKRLEADAEDSGSPLSDLDIPPGEDDSAPDVNRIQSQSKSSERSKSPDKTVQTVEEKALGADIHRPERTITESVKVERILATTKTNSPKPTSRKRKIEKLSIEDEEKVEISKDDEGSPAKSKQRKKTKREVNIGEGEERSEKPTRKRKTKEEKESELMPLAARTNGLKMFVGAHVSSAKGLSSKIFDSRASRFIYLHRRMLRICQFNSN